ncbi:hypothetical protein BLA29_015493, partial [Euroglyphus maynei]
MMYCKAIQFGYPKWESATSVRPV